MATYYGRRSFLIKSAHINQVVNVNGTIVSQGDTAENGGFEFRWYPLNGGCGSTANSKFYIELRDPFAWTNIAYEYYTTGTSSCWNFNQGGSYGLGNFLSFDSTIDRLSNSINSFELSKYDKKMSACDNLSTNFYHPSFVTGTFRRFFVSRRRNSAASLCNINVELSCNNTGTAHTIFIRNIYVW